LDPVRPEPSDEILETLRGIEQPPELLHLPGSRGERLEETAIFRHQGLNEESFLLVNANIANLSKYLPEQSNALLDSLLRVVRSNPLNVPGKLIRCRPISRNNHH
jgi:hypothetical protein